MAKSKIVEEEDVWGFDAIPEGGKEQIATGTIVRCLILDFGYSSAHIKEVAEANKAILAEAENLGIEAEPMLLSFKKGGIQAKVAVIEQYQSGAWVPTFKENGIGEWEEPAMTCYTQIAMLPPPVIHSKNYSSFTKGLNYVDSYGAPKISGFLPSCYPAKDFHTQLPDPVKEEARQTAWKDALEIYEALTEEQAKSYLLQSLAKRFVLVAQKDNAPSGLMRPRTGVMFEAKIRRKEGSRMFDLERFSWDKGTSQYNIYGSLYAHIDDELVEGAKEITILRDTNKAKREEEFQAKKQQHKEYSDGVPF